MSQEGTDGKFGRVALWIVTVAFAVPMLLAGSSKFFSSSMWLSMFEGWGYPPALAYPVGVLEVVGAAATLVPRYATYGAALVAVIMAVAAGTVLTHPGEMGATVPVVNVIGFTLIAVARAGERRRSR
jgi:uncharacterized membrane protein YphA (DoxX/SURF4 family)